jgi:CO dehydrogenase/acetyl-CoA synthase beta subunit
LSINFSLSLARARALPPSRESARIFSETIGWK